MAVELNYRIAGKGPHVLLLHAVGMDLTCSTRSLSSSRRTSLFSLSTRGATEVALCAAASHDGLRG